MVRSATSPATRGEPAHKPKRSLDEVRAHWLEAFRRVRIETERRASRLSPEDQIVQSMADASSCKMASRTRHMVLRTISAGAVQLRLQNFRRAISILV